MTAWPAAVAALAGGQAVGLGWVPVAVIFSRPGPIPPGPGLSARPAIPAGAGTGRTPRTGRHLGGQAWAGTSIGRVTTTLNISDSPASVAGADAIVIGV